MTEYQKEIVELLDSALKKLPMHTGKTYRTVSFYDLFDAEGEYNEFLEQHILGNIIKYDAYTSASTELDGHPMTDDTKYGVTLEIDGVSGRDFEGFGDNTEKEVVYPRGLSVIVTDVGKDVNGRPYIKVKEIIENDKRLDEGGLEASSEERSDVLQQVQASDSRNGDLQEVSGQDTGRGIGSENALQGVRANSQGIMDGDDPTASPDTRSALSDTEVLSETDASRKTLHTDIYSSIPKHRKGDRKLDSKSLNPHRPRLQPRLGYCLPPALAGRQKLRNAEGRSAG